MQESTLAKFNVKKQPEFFQELTKRVNNYFSENNVSKYGNLNMWLKSAFMICLYLIPLALLYSNLFTSNWVVMGLWGCVGLGMSGIGLSIMHDANHGSYSTNKTVNNVMGFLLNVIGGYRVNWIIQHNVLHHTYTNVHEHDEDLESSVLRLSPHQKPSKSYRFQAYYATFFYGLMTVYWSISKDFEQIKSFEKQGLLQKQGLNYNMALRQVIINKIIFFSLTIVIPMLLMNIAWWQILLGNLLMHAVCGWVLAFIFQLAHVIEETEFVKPDENNSVENNWAIHQMNTTANFSNGNRIFSWFIGGLNYQVEHHLFPSICHIHYRDISTIVKQTALEFNVPYYEHKTFFGALKSHFSLINRLGKGEV